MRRLWSSGSGWDGPVGMGGIRNELGSAWGCLKEQVLPHSNAHAANDSQCAVGQDGWVACGASRVEGNLPQKNGSWIASRALRACSTRLYRAVPEIPVAACCQLERVRRMILQRELAPALRATAYVLLWRDALPPWQRFWGNKPTALRKLDRSLFWRRMVGGRCLPFC